MELSLNYLYSITFYIPECIAVLVMAGILFLEIAYKKHDSKRILLKVFTIVGLIVTFGALVFNLDLPSKNIFYDAIVIDRFSVLVKIIAVIAALISYWYGLSSRDIYDSLKSEFGILIVGGLIGTMLLASANNMLTLYLGIEMLSILSYPLAAMKRLDEKSVEAGLKYALYGGLSAGIMLFGMSLIFGILGTIQFGEIAGRITTLDVTQKAILVPAFLFFFVGLGYKISCVPFHMWTPDVYEGSPIPVTAFFSVVPKIGGIAALVRVTSAFFVNENLIQYSWVAVLTLVAALTMTVGNVSALGQRSVKRMLAYSSIAQIGNILLGVLVLDSIGQQAIIFYFFGYMIMTLLAFGITAVLSDQYGNDYFDRFNGLIYRNPFMAICLIIAMLSLAGMPPLIGFVAKFNIIAAIVKKGLFGLAIIAVLNSVISLYYYMRLARLVVFKMPDSTEKLFRLSIGRQALFVSMALFILIVGIFWEDLYKFSDVTNQIKLAH
ncbi:MAG: NADH-quinone oxidoreductase subunit N [Bdellovibrio sp.]|nr:NADH-quinone oxidoreductase subunit N [Bdellovibrio sp.]